VHMFVVAKALAPDLPRPTVLYGYGGFNQALTPTYTPSMLSWVEAGGVWAVANLRGGSEFERAVWGQIAKIPYGEMVTYGSIATALGDPGAARAVGTACNHNPVPVIVPCHRVVGAGGKMVGFGGGIERKRKLLELEARVALAKAWS